VLLRVAVLLVLLCAAGPAAAGELAWSAPSGCPAAEKLRADVERLGGARLADAPLTARADAWRDESGRWFVDVAIAGPQGEPRSRRVAGATCGEVAEAAVLIVALALEARAAAPPPPVAVSIVPPPLVPPPPVVVPVAPAPVRRLAWSASAFAGLDGTALPHPAFGLGLALALDAGRVRYELRGAAFLPRSALVSPAPAVEVLLAAGAARACPRLTRFDAFALRACAGFELGALRAASPDPLWTKVGLGLWAAPEAALLLAYHPAPWLALGVEAEGLVPLARERFAFGSVEVHRAGPVDGRAYFSLRVVGR
jgi:hypothetical protein